MRAILMYHSIDESGSPISLPEAVFRRHIEWLASHGPTVVPVDRLLAGPPHEPAVAITFDDAFSSFTTVAWPLLREYGMPVTVFVPTGHAGTTNEWGGRTERNIPVLPILGWDEIARLAEDGVSIGSHTRTHPHLDRIGADAMHEELHGSALEIAERTGTRPAGLAFPYGAHDAAVVRAAEQLYDYACTTEMRLLDATPRRHMLPRLDAYYFQTAGTLECWGTPLLRIYLSVRAGARRSRQVFSSASLP